MAISYYPIIIMVVVVDIVHCCGVDINQVFDALNVIVNSMYKKVSILYAFDVL